MVLEESVAGSELLREEIDRIIGSEEFRSSEVLRRLLLYLADKAASGEADKLKEYTVAIEGLGKPSSYDPQHNSAVRIQVGRLRQKLAEYYRNEGLHDPLIVDLPKGRFRLVCEPRKVETLSAPVELLPEPTPIAVIEEPRRRNGSLIAIAAALLIAAASLGYAFYINATHSAVVNASTWTPELEQLWSAFSGSKHPLLILIEDPLFVELHSNPGVYYRDRSLNQWSDIQKSETMQKLSQTLQSTSIQPSRYYTAFGEADAAFRLGRVLGPRVPLYSLAKVSQVTWQQMSDNNVVFIGVENLFFEQASGLPIQPQLLPVLDGVNNPHPHAGELPVYTDQYQTAPKETGYIYALVTHLPGPQGGNDVFSFTSNRSAGYLAAVQAFSDPKLAKTLTEHLKAEHGGQMPRYYQVLLKVHFTDDLPTETTYVLSRELNK